MDDRSNNSWVVCADNAPNRIDIIGVLLVEGAEMAKRRVALKDGDMVWVCAPNTPDKFRGLRGVIVGVRGDDRTWTVKFSNRSMDWSVFRREELEKL
jgi:hypothetical protein